jgi:hypothetical protein
MGDTLVVDRRPALRQLHQCYMGEKYSPSNVRRSEGSEEALYFVFVCCCLSC